MTFIHMTRFAFTARRWPLIAAAGIALSTLLLGGCDMNKALQVQSPSRIPAASLEDPSNAALLVNGAVSDFECAFGAYVVVGGLITEELEDYLQTADRWPFDQRTLQSNNPRYSRNDCTAQGVYTPLQTARVSADNIRQLLEKWTDAEVPNRAALLARANAYEAWSQLLLGEGFCSTVFSTIQNGAFVYAPEITRSAALSEAEAHFTAAITATQGLSDTASVNLQRMAYLGRARTRLDLGNLAGAASDAGQVPANFVYNATASSISSRRNNRVYNESNSLGVSATVGPVYRGMNDPRVQFLDLARTNAVGLKAYAQLKYTSAATPIPLATGDEAQLIIAEADIGTSPATTITIIDAERAKGNQGAYTGPVDAASLKSEVIDQRRRALFLTGTELGDIIRYNLAASLTPAKGAAFPYGGTYGDQVCMPLPDVERLNNPVLNGGL